MDFGLAGRVVVVSGGTSGIGLATAIALVQDGARVAVLGTSEKRLTEATEKLCSAANDGAKVLGVRADVRDPKSLERAARTVAAELGDVYGVVACAGIGGAGRAEDLPLEDLENVLAVNVGGVLSTCQAFVHGMIERREGSIVLIGSINSFGGQSGRTHYTASKHAVIGLVKNFAIEWGSYNVRVNGIAPGPVDTPLLRANVPTSFMAEVFDDRIPLGRLARAEEIAYPTLMLLSEMGSYVNGATLTVDGGMTAGPFTRRRGRDLGSNRLLAQGVYSEE